MTGIVNISAEDYEAMPSRFDGEWLRSNFPDVAQSMDRFIDKIKQETHGEVLGDLEILRIPWICTGPAMRPAGSGSRRTQRSPVRQLAGVPRRRFGHWLSVLSIDFAWLRVCDVPGRLIAQRDLPLRDVFDRYELYIYKQWLRVYMQSKMIKHNKDLFECVDDPLALLDKLHIY